MTSRDNTTIERHFKEVTDIPDFALSFYAAKKETKKLSKRLRGRQAVDYLPYTLFFTKNPKLAYAQTE